MKKEKFKLHSKKSLFLGTKFIALFVTIILLAISTTYAMFTNRLTISGTVSADLEYTYYFRNSKNWSGNIYAYIFDRQSGTDTPYCSWPGTQMSYDSSTGLYSVTFSGSTAHNYIIFNNNNGTQTSDISITPKNVNNSIYDPDISYNNPGYQRLIFNTYQSSGWNNVYIYLFNSATDVAVAWPGINITSNVFSNKHYYYEMPVNQYKYVVFNNGSSAQQTVDLAIPPMSDAICSYKNTNKANSTKYNYRKLDFIYKF